MKTSKHPKLANGQPAISCFALSQAELVRRQTIAHERAEQALQQQKGEAPDEALAALGHQIARSILWHADFFDGLRLLVCDQRLYCLTANLPSDLLATNDGQPLDFWDYGYVADLLRELLIDYGLPLGDAQNVRRALAWVEEKGSGLRDYSRERD